jgi:HSP20 family protein
MGTSITHLMHSLIDQLTETLEKSQWRPPADVYRIGAGWLIKFDLAGVRPEDIAISTSGNRLQVVGQRRDWVIEEAQQSSAYLMEISYSRFSRTLELPCDLRNAQVAMEYREGMLLIRIQCEASES